MHLSLWAILVPVKTNRLFTSILLPVVCLSQDRILIKRTALTQEESIVDARRESEIESIALNVLHHVGITRFPVDMDQAAHLLGLSVYDARFQDSHISGAVQKSHEGGKIWVNRFDSVVRQRFTIAHMIAHWIWHTTSGDAWSEPQYLVDVELVEWHPDSGWSGSHKEQEANRFAAAFLMPLPWLDALCLAHPDWSIALFADFCQVSFRAMRMRLERMGRLSWANPL